VLCGWWRRVRQNSRFSILRSRFSVLHSNLLQSPSPQKIAIKPKTFVRTCDCVGVSLARVCFVFLQWKGKFWIKCNPQKNRGKTNKNLPWRTGKLIFSLLPSENLRIHSHQPAGASSVFPYLVWQIKMHKLWMKVPLRAWQPIICYYYARGPVEKTKTVWERKLNLAKTPPLAKNTTPWIQSVCETFFKVLCKKVEQNMK